MFYYLRRCRQLTDMKCLKSIFLMVILIVIFIKIFSSYMVSFFFFSLLEPDGHIRYCHHFTAPFVMAFAGKLLTFWSSPKQLGQMKPNLLIVATPHIFTRMIYSLWTCSGCENSWNTTYLMLGTFKICHVILHGYQGVLLAEWSKLN